MSKSAPHPSSKIFLTDSASEIHAKIKSAVTDSTAGVTWDPANRPGIATLLQIYAGYSDDGVGVVEIAARYGDVKGIMRLKDDLAEVVSESLRGFRDEFARIRTEEGYLAAEERRGAERAREAAQATMREVRAAVGTT